jgi:hypothetical protein
MSNQTDQPARRVAIIGVHGVAHHDPGETANAMADLLLSLPSYDPREKDDQGKDRSCGEVNSPRKFRSFTSTGIQIPLQPICIDKDKRVEAKYREPRLKFHKDPFFKFLQEGSAEFARAISPTDDPAYAARLAEHGAVGDEFTAKLLQDYRGGATGNKYVTSRLEGCRDEDKTEVHIYEMFWADLARPANSLASFLFAFFQLILHLPSLSRLAIDTRPNANWVWKTFQSLHRYAARMLQIFIPLAKVALLIVLFAAVPDVLHAKSLRLLTAIIIAVVFFSISLVVMKMLTGPSFQTKWSWLAASFLPGLVMAVIVFELVSKQLDDQIAALVAEWWFVNLFLVWYVLKAYIKVHSGGARRTALILYSGFYWVVLAVFCRYAIPYDSVSASLWTSQWLLLTLRLFWVVFCILAISAAIFGIFACWKEVGTAERRKAFAALRTSCLALALPAFLFVFVTAFIWAGLFSIARKISHDRPFFQGVHGLYVPNVTPLKRITNFDLFPDGSIGDWDCNKPEAEGVKSCTSGAKICPHCADKPPEGDYLRGVLAWSVGYGSYVTVVVTFAGLLILVWWALPSVLTERFPLRRSYDPTDFRARNQTEPPRDSNNRESVWMGSWISHGIDSVSIVTFLTWIAIFVVPLVFLYAWSWRAYFEDKTRAVICGAIAVAGTTALLTALVRYSSPVLRVILDVDTYLRTGPKEATPRAKIFERYVSLLRYVAKYPGPDEQDKGYDEVIIVAHSLGSLISADLMRFLHNPKTQTYDEDLSPFDYAQEPKGGAGRKIPIKLFTMGNPLRQLLNRFFPYLYDWVREMPDSRLAALGLTDAEEIKKLHDDEIRKLPDPSELGVTKWVNAYRSGDYVGRSLWLNEWYKRTTTCGENGIYPEPIYKVDTGARIEFCIGAGAHTHYWDDTAPDIARALNELI